MNKVFIYGIQPIGTDEVFYIGSTSRTIDDRFRQHLSNVRSGSHTNHRFWQKCFKGGLDNLETVEIDCVDNADRDTAEYGHIQQYLTEGYKLTNVLHSIEQRDRYFVTGPQLVLANEIVKLVNGMVGLAWHEFKNNQPLYSMVPSRIAALRHRADDYQSRRGEVERAFDFILTLYQINTNGLCLPPLSQ